jgi:hypothetical protein
MGEGRGAYRILVGRLEGRRPLGRPRHRWEDNIKMDLQEVECGGMDWIDMADDRDRWQALVNAECTVLEFLSFFFYSVVCFVLYYLQGGYGM